MGWMPAAVVAAMFPAVASASSDASAAVAAGGTGAQAGRHAEGRRGEVRRGERERERHTNGSATK